jgi:hypothetical protein
MLKPLDVQAQHRGKASDAHLLDGWLLLFAMPTYPCILDGQ